MKAGGRELFEKAIFGAEKVMCDTRSTTYWDSKTCQCRSKNVAPRETDTIMSNCLEDFPMMAYSRSHCLKNISIRLCLKIFRVSPVSDRNILDLRTKNL